MSLASVIDSATQLEYRLSQYPLGEGATARVWQGVNEQATPPVVAVKIAHRGTPLARLEEFWGELSLLEELAVTAARRHVPWAHKGTSRQDPTAAIIIMELVPNEWQLMGLAREAGGTLSESLALQAGSQYAQLHVALHARNYTTRGDRKLTDLRWERESERLIVLDWNRARRVASGETPAPHSKEVDWDQLDMRAELIRQDLRGFGELWSQLVLDKHLFTLPSVEDESDAAWRALSRGFRAILARSLGCRSAWGYRTARELADAIDLHRERVRLAEDHPEQVAAEAESLLRLGERASDGVERSRLADEMLTLCDLLNRSPAAEAWADTKLEPLISWARASLFWPLQQAAEAATRINDLLRQLNYRRAVSVAAEELEVTHSSGSGAAGLRLDRRLIVAQAGIQGNELGYDMGAAVASLQRSVGYLEEDALQPALAAVEEAKRGCPESVMAFPERIGFEILIRSDVASAEKATREGRSESAAERRIRACKTWQTLDGLDSSYAMDLRADLDALDRWLSQASLDAGLEDLLVDRQAAFREVVDELLSSLSAG